ncbi:hypothetical protein GCM10011415_04490 [Salipiger pallidus]|uniref:AsmA-like C-terminal region n=2 Tax=Salipiger pallidus TaxID=1775170 RepID=A0A8J2ZH15_9RHOB|nr:hypothetical protein GCM10011415_04490 [Salipiger pallidus]
MDLSVANGSDTGSRQSGTSSCEDAESSTPSPEDDAATPGGGPAGSTPETGGTEDGQTEGEAPERGTAKTPIAPKPRKKGRKRRWLGGIFSVLTVIVLLAGAGLWSVMERPLSAPGWLREQIEERIAQAVPGIDLSFGDLQLEVRPDGMARVRLVDVGIRSDTGAPVAQLSNLVAGMTFADLFRGRIDLRLVHLSGASLAMRRDADGRFGLALGDVFASDTPTPDIPTMLANLQRALEDPRLDKLTSISAEALTIRYEDARAQRGWTADGGRVSITREGRSLRLAGDVSVLGRGDVPATLAVTAENTIGEGSAQFGVNLSGLEAQDIATQSPALAWLGGLRAPISGALRASMTEEGRLGALNATLQIGAGVLQPNTRTEPIPFSFARTYFSYDPAAGTLTFDDIHVASALGTLQSSGRAQLQQNGSGRLPDAMVGQFRISQFEADPEGFLDSPVRIDGAELDWRLAFDPFRFELGRLRITDAELPLRVSGSLAAEPEGWRMALDARVARLERDKLMSLWPEGGKEGNVKARKWVSENIHAATLHDAVIALRLDPGGRLKPYIDARIEGGELTYARNLPRLEGASGQFTLYDDRMAVTLEDGYVAPPQGGRLDGAGSTFTIPDMTVRPWTGILDLKARGPMEAVLSYIDSPKLEIMQKAKKPVALGDGTAALTGQLVIPLKRGVQREEIAISASGSVTGFASTEIVPGKRLSAQRLALDLNDDRIVVSGRVQMDGIPFNGSWTQPLTPGTGRVEGQVTLSEAAAQSLGIGLPPGTISGSGPAQLTIDLPNGQAPRFSLTSSLAGVGLSLPQIGWRLTQGGTGRFEVAGRFGRPLTVERLSLNAAGLEARGAVRLTSSGQFDRLDLPRLRVGGWLDGSAVLSSRGQGAPPAVALNGGTLDLRRAPFGGGSGGSGSGGGPIAVRLDRLQVSEQIALTGFQGSFAQTAAGLDGQFTASVGGQAPITGRVLPTNGGSAIRLQARDAGDVLEGAGIFRNVQDGTFDLTLVPVPGQTGHYDGNLEIGGARLNNAPAITGLIDAISVVGLIDELNGPGLYFSEVDARFRLTPTQVILQRSSATGPSMGISMDGYYNLGSQTMDMQGVLSPIYIINGIGRLFSRKGEGLIGFNFNLRGPVREPQVSVNPLSVFTPGMFRDIFRRPPPSLNQ